METIGEKLMFERKKAGFSQEELAEKAKVNLKTIQRIENNKNTPREGTLNLICQALNLELNQLDIQPNTLATRLASTFFMLLSLTILNILMLLPIAYLCLDSGANLNSQAGAFLLSLFIPIFIVYNTSKTNCLTRTIKYGSGIILYILLVFTLHGMREIVSSKLLFCMLIWVLILYYGDRIVKFLQRKQDQW